MGCASFSWQDLDGTDQTRYAMITVNGGEAEDTFVMEKMIPVGTLVTVTEVDTGLQFNYVSGDDSKTIALTDAADATQFKFTNTHGGPGGGHGVVNRFRADDHGAPVWRKEQLPDSDPYKNNGVTQNSGNIAEETK